MSNRAALILAIGLMLAAFINGLFPRYVPSGVTEYAWVVDTWTGCAFFGKQSTCELYSGEKQ